MCAVSLNKSSKDHFAKNKNFNTVCNDEDLSKYVIFNHIFFMLLKLAYNYFKNLFLRCSLIGFLKKSSENKIVNNVLLVRKRQIP